MMATGAGELNRLAHEVARADLRVREICEEASDFDQAACATAIHAREKALDAYSSALDALEGEEGR